MPRGGKRPGAGAPKGNLNGFKTGKHSPRFQALVEAVARLPHLRDMALAHYRLHQRREQRAKKIIRQHLIYILLQDPQQFNQIMRALHHLEKAHIPLEDALQKINTNQIRYRTIRPNQTPDRPQPTKTPLSAAFPHGRGIQALPAPGSDTLEGTLVARGHGGVEST